MLGQVAVGPSRSSTLTLYHRPNFQTMQMLVDFKQIDLVITA